MIAFDAISSVAAATATSLTFAHTCTGDHRILFVGGRDKIAAATVVTGITYNGVAMTQIDGVQVPSNIFITLWVLMAPDTGSNNVVVSASESVSLRFIAVSYTGAKQANQPENSDTNTATGTSTINTTITPAPDKCWMVCLVQEKNGTLVVTSGSGDTVRLSGDAGGVGFVDTGEDISPAAANTMTVNFSGGSNLAAVAATIIPNDAISGSWFMH